MMRRGREADGKHDERRGNRKEEKEE